MESGKSVRVVLAGYLSPFKCTTSLLDLTSTNIESLTHVYSIKGVSSYPHHYVLLIVSYEIRLYLYDIVPNIRPLNRPRFNTFLPLDA